MAAIHLADYRPYPYRLSRTDLTLRLEGDHAFVEAVLALEATTAAVPAPLELAGIDLELLEISLDGQPLAAPLYRHTAAGLTLLNPPGGPFQLRTLVRLEPQANTSLEGLYVSGDMVTTQCEAEGFRRITFHPDRPDVLSCFRVRLEADQQRYPVLLSNGNGVESGALPSGVDGRARHYAVWDDPFPKPSYLFALVAGQLEEVKGCFVTASGREVRLRLHVEPGDGPYTAHAMASLKRCMAWDEQVYGLEYDLNEFNIVAVRHFNMGAMENKSLNIFNSKLVLADAETATDAELERVESVIAHEYFHNWTGNRITCRDWFQLSLKEGLTVFRDQCFSADLHGHSLNRIENVAFLRNSQFREDSGPTAHAVQPDHYQAIDNFYTTTIYEKGAELIRALQTLLGQETFFKGMALYVDRHDGSAATIDDFLAAMRDGAADVELPFDFEQFRLWYSQAGTPLLRIRRRWNRQRGTLELTISQQTPPTPGQSHKQPLVIPVALGLVDQSGQDRPVQIGTGSQGVAVAADPPRDWGSHTKVLVIDGAEQTLRFEGLPNQAQPPALSLLRHFSAPVQLEIGRPARELVHLFAHDSDPFARWDAGQQLLRRALRRRAKGRPDALLEDELLEAFGRILADPTLSEASRSALMSLPALPELEEGVTEPDPPAFYWALEGLRRRLGEVLAAPLHQALDRCRSQWDLPWPEGCGDRLLSGQIWRWLVAAGDPAAIAAARAAVDGPSMTLARAGLAALQPQPLAERQAALDAFYDRWQERPVILDAWFALEASAPFDDGLERVRRLLDHPRYDPMAPNSVRAVLGGLAGNVVVFHAADGSGYRFLAQQIGLLDQRNPITAARLCKIFSRWQSYGPSRRQAMGQALRELADLPGLSENSREVVDQCLGLPT
jgi:aminopeptidase N